MDNFAVAFARPTCRRLPHWIGAWYAFGHLGSQIEPWSAFGHLDNWIGPPAAVGAGVPGSRRGGIGVTGIKPPAVTARCCCIRCRGLFLGRLAIYNPRGAGRLGAPASAFRKFIWHRDLCDKAVIGSNIQTQMQHSDATFQHSITSKSRGAYYLKSRAERAEDFLEACILMANDEGR
jgi:hypothetical protein